MIVLYHVSSSLVVGLADGHNRFCDASSRHTQQRGLPVVRYAVSVQYLQTEEFFPWVVSRHPQVELGTS